MTYTIAVRELCEFTAKRGDLDLRFTPAPTSSEGMAGHAVAAARRGKNYRAEVNLSGRFEALQVRGRADGYDPEHQRVDEVKTFKGSLERQPATHRHLHWAQAKVYGWLLCLQEDLTHIDVALVYFDIGSQQETVLTERCTAKHLQAHFELQCRQFMAWATQQTLHRAARDAALRALAFPFADFRKGQRPLAEAVYRATLAGRCLLAQAPTGIGKTMGTLFPLLKAAPAERIDKIFFLAAKTSGRQLALNALQALLPGHAFPGANAPASSASSASSEPHAAPSGLHSETHCIAIGAPAGTPASDDVDAARDSHPPPLALRVLELVARDKACEHPDKACHGESCPLALGFYDRLPAARAAALAPATHATHGCTTLAQAQVRSVALQHQVCPYYLSQELVRWADVVVGDYHYYFDQGGLLHGLTQANQWRVALLVDEAHNLVERARKMYTAQLHPETLAQARGSATAAVHPVVKKALDKVRRTWTALDKSNTEPYTVHDGFPGPLLAALQQCNRTLGDHFAEHAAAVEGPLQVFYFDALHMVRMAEQLDTHSLVDSIQPVVGSVIHTARRPARPMSTVCIRCIVPAPYLRPRWAAAHSSTLFSATLEPVRYTTDLLGLPTDRAWIDVESPFDAAQLQVHVAQDISTRFLHRTASLTGVASRMAEQFHAAPGNYLAFFSSYDYLRQVADCLAQHDPLVPQWSQSPRMSEAAQREFLARFDLTSAGIGFAVLGGAFAEGIDLPGQRLIGAFLATLGLPQINPVNEQIRTRMHHLFGAGYEYTYLYPGLQKVVQAAGRVIRSPQDEGVVHLMDDRFAQPAVQALLPAWWVVPPAASRRRPAAR